MYVCVYIKTYTTHRMNAFKNFCFIFAKKFCATLRVTVTDVSSASRRGMAPVLRCLYSSSVAPPAARIKHSASCLYCSMKYTNIINTTCMYVLSFEIYRLKAVAIVGSHLSLLSIFSCLSFSVLYMLFLLHCHVLHTTNNNREFTHAI